MQAEAPKCELTDSDKTTIAGREQKANERRHNVSEL